MKSSFDKSVAFVLRWENWKSDIPGDKGGKTIWGVSSFWFPKDYEAMVPMDSDTAKKYAIDFYRREFWNKLKCDDRTWPLDFLTFNCAVNQGPALARSLASKCEGDWFDFIMRQIQAYVNIPGQVMEGWINRTIDAYKLAKGA